MVVPQSTPAVPKLAEWGLKTTVVCVRLRTYHSWGTRN